MQAGKEGGKGYRKLEDMEFVRSLVGASKRNVNPRTFVRTFVRAEMVQITAERQMRSHYAARVSRLSERANERKVGTAGDARGGWDSK